MIPAVNPESMVDLIGKQALTQQRAGSGQVPIRNSSVQERKLRRATQEFETMLISDFWKAMTESFAADDEEAIDPGHSTWKDMGVQAMAGAMSKAGGLGLGKLILKHLEPLVQDEYSAKGDT